MIDLEATFEKLENELREVNRKRRNAKEKLRRINGIEAHSQKNANILRRARRATDRF
ncbi:hypothetical protein KIN20_006127 [Parelaphostrongylus tenuis]|uniref:Uncharacterized protein n=1 Tax=Parelaphostrongylus tenuis TaxID=148309 RepID=A0AAD5QFR4_PARTN|nr:hypothetical protein KIN20_006127 [Parelaphostrongylus tenuis]